ncbi:MAG: hypothetical protein K8L97_20500 [Anaerolineae bacterium]|nr:hypothetical protein [Anaerolineae bacterium]
MFETLSGGEKKSFGEGVIQLGNGVFLALVIGQILTKTLDVLAVLLGLILWLGCYWIAYLLMKGRG